MNTFWAEANDEQFESFVRFGELEEAFAAAGAQQSKNEGVLPRSLFFGLFFVFLLSQFAQGLKVQIRFWSKIVACCSCDHSFIMRLEHVDALSSIHEPSLHLIYSNWPALSHSFPSRMSCFLFLLLLPVHIGFSGRRCQQTAEARDQDNEESGTILHRCEEIVCCFHHSRSTQGMFVWSAVVVVVAVAVVIV